MHWNALIVFNEKHKHTVKPVILKFLIGVSQYDWILVMERGSFFFKKGLFNPS